MDFINNANTPEKLEQTEQPHSTEISINAKGMWSGKVKCYGNTPNDAYDEAIKKAEVAYNYHINHILTSFNNIL